MSRPRSHRRRPHWRSTRVIGLALVVVALSSAAVVRLNLQGQPTAAAHDVVEIHSAHGTSFVPALQGKRPLFILALGSDARPGQQVERERADSIHIIGVDVANHRATILGFPRDSWVPIPGHGTSKINTAMSFGGPRLLISTLENLTGIRIVNRIGPLKVHVLQGMHDRYSGADFAPGIHKFRGDQALAFARDRHDVPQGDISRSANQGRLLQAALSKLRQDFAKDAASLFIWMATGWRNVHTDLSPATILDLALTATQIHPSQVNNLVVPSSTGSVGAQSVVFIQSGARTIYADMRADGIAR
jgi:LCP family protein required for cell wall assembly